MRLTLLACLAILTAEQSTEAQTQSFPYEAVVKTNQAEILSGADYYATDRLRRGTKITVYRHDPGGWYVIAPPPGSFSWIRADYVQVTGSRTGTLTENNVMVRVGSALGNDRDVYQEKLYKGDRVEILGEQVFQTEEGSVRLFKIVPPRGERRWISGRHVVSLGEYSRIRNHADFLGHQDDNTPEQTFAANTGISSKPKTEQKKLTVTGPLGSFKENSPQSPELVKNIEKLEQLDENFRSMIKLDAGKWNLDQLETDYKKLQKNTTDTEVEYQIDQRLAAVKRYWTVKKEYDDFIKITTETTKKDRQLLAVLNQQKKENTDQETQPHSQSSAPVLKAPQSLRTSTIPPPIPFASRPQNYPPRISPVPAQISSLRPVPLPVSQIPRQVVQAHSKRAPLFDGAGIIQRTAYVMPGAPRHVLTDSKGHVLAYLKGRWGLSLDRYLGQPVGINGPKMFRPDLRSHLIRVNALRPVQLSE